MGGEDWGPLAVQRLLDKFENFLLLQRQRRRCFHFFSFFTHQQMSILWVKEDLCLKRNGLPTKILGLVAK